MSDAFDVFEPFEPPEAAEERTAGNSAAEDPGVEEPVDDGSTAREPRAARRWSAPATRPTPPPDAKRARSQPRPEAPTRRLPTGADFEEALDAVLFREPAGRTTQARSGEVFSKDPVADAALDAFRRVALPELEAAVERLLARGHFASLAEDLTQAQREPAMVVRFRPNQGPLAAVGSSTREPARFELRLAPDLDGETQVVAGYTLGTSDAPFTLLSRERASAVRGDWVAGRFVDFVRRALTPD